MLVCRIILRVCCGLKLLVVFVDGGDWQLLIGAYWSLMVLALQTRSKGPKSSLPCTAYFVRTTKQNGRCLCCVLFLFNLEHPQNTYIEIKLHELTAQILYRFVAPTYASLYFTTTSIFFKVLFSQN